MVMVIGIGVVAEIEELLVRQVRKTVTRDLPETQQSAQPVEHDLVVLGRHPLRRGERRSVRAHIGVVAQPGALQPVNDGIRIEALLATHPGEG